MSMQLSVTVRNAQLDAIETAIGTSPILKIRDGSAPANCAASDTGTVLASLTLPSDWMAAASSGSKALSGTWSDASADATGTAAHFRIYDSGGSTCHVQGTVTIVDVRDVVIASDFLETVIESEVRTTMSDFTVFKHAPGASRVYRLVWEDAETDDVASETFAVSGPDSALTVSAYGSSGANRQFRATGGTEGAAYDVLHTVTFTSGDIDARTVRLVCVRR